MGFELLPDLDAEKRQCEATELIYFVTVRAENSGDYF